MSVDDVVDVAVALGKGVYSVGEDLAYGIERTAEGIGFGEDGRVATIGHENSAMIDLMGEFLEYGLSDDRSPLFRIIVHVLEHYYSYFPDSAIDYLAKQAGIGAAYGAGRLVIGKKLATVVAGRITIAIAKSAVYKRLAKKIGVSAGASFTGLGTPIGLLMMQGVMQRASYAALRLRGKSPTLYRILKEHGDLQLLYFLVEEPLKKYVEGVSLAEQNVQSFRRNVDFVYSARRR